jgi:hypothetical protein
MNPVESIAVNNFALSFILVMVVLIIVVPRRLAFVPLLLTTCYITLGQEFVVAGLNFTLLRILILAGWIRLFIRQELSSIKLNRVDKVFLLWNAATIVLGTLLEGSTSGFINRLGLAYNAIGLYFLFRFFIRGFQDLERIFSILAIILLPLALSMFIEAMTGHNFFSVFGGVPESTIMRGDRMRCQGPFRHPILAGTFGATLIPLFLMLYFKPHQKKVVAIFGIIEATLITITSSSSGPLMAFGSVIIGVAIWPIRSKMKYLRRGALLALILLQLFMKAPIWYLIGKFSNISGGDGWHRSELIDTAIRHLNEWWLIGTTYTKHWLPNDTLYDSKMIDITNQYILEGVNGGLCKMVLFIAIIVTCYRVLGSALKATNGELSKRKLDLWLLGVALFSHVVSFISVSYFDQIVVIWYMLLAMIAMVEQVKCTEKKQSFADLLYSLNKSKSKSNAEIPSIY